MKFPTRVPMERAKPDLRAISDLNAKTVEALLERAQGFKLKQDQGVRKENILDGRVVAMVFEKPSLRTKMAFEVATLYLGGHPVFLSSAEVLASGNNKKGRESIPDIARNLERFADVIIARVYSHSVIQELAKAVRTPIINALCDRHHPTQALADLLAIKLRFGDLRGLRVAYVGDGNNVATSLMQICALSGVHFSIATPPGYEIPKEDWSWGEKKAQASGAELRATHDPKTIVTGADVIYTDTFVSMGQEQESLTRIDIFKGFQVNAGLMSLAKPAAIFMHCLPAHRGEEVTDQVMDSAQSIVFDQAECRLHVAKAVLLHCLDV